MRTQMAQINGLPLSFLLVGILLWGQVAIAEGGRQAELRGENAALQNNWRAVEYVVEVRMTDMVMSYAPRPVVVYILSVNRLYRISKTDDATSFPGVIYFASDLNLNAAVLTKGETYLLFVKPSHPPVVKSALSEEIVPVPAGPYFEIAGGRRGCYPVGSPAYAEALDFLRARGVDVEAKIIPRGKLEDGVDASGAAAKTGNWKEQEWAVEVKTERFFSIGVPGSKNKACYVDVQGVSVERLYHAAEKSQAPPIPKTFYMRTELGSRIRVWLTEGQSYLLFLKPGSVPVIGPECGKLNMPIPVGPYFEVVDGWHGCYPVDSSSYKKALDFLRAEGISVDPKARPANKTENELGAKAVLPTPAPIADPAGLAAPGTPVKP